MSQEIQVCPLCMEDYDLEDLSFIPCTCGYQICRFCWHRIKTGENGTCPACRKPYTEDPAQFKPLSSTELHQSKKLKKLKQQEEKEKRKNEGRKNFANARVIQKNLMFVVGLPLNIIDSEVLKRQEYFGKYGKITKVTLNKMPTSSGPPNAQNSTYQYQSAYVMFSRIDDTLRAIRSINSSNQQFGKSVKASLGTTKYCSRFVKGLPCGKNDCMYLHEAVDEEACFTKEEIHQGKHVAYEQKLYSIYCKGDDLSPSPVADGNCDKTVPPSKRSHKTASSSSSSSSSTSSSVPKSNSSKQSNPKASQSLLTSTTTSEQSKPPPLPQSNCWKVGGGAAIVKSNLGLMAGPKIVPGTQKGTTMTTFTKNGIQRSFVGAILGTNKMTDDRKERQSGPDRRDADVREKPLVSGEEVDSERGGEEEEEEEEDEEEDDEEELAGLTEDVGTDEEVRSGASSGRGRDGDTGSSEPATSSATSTSTDSPDWAGTPSVDSDRQSKAGTEQDAEFPENDEIISSGELDSTPSGRARVYDGVASTPHAKGQVPLAPVLDVSGIEADLAGLATTDLGESEDDNSGGMNKLDDHHDDDIDPWKIVSIGLDLLENERILEERPPHCQTRLLFPGPSGPVPPTTVPAERSFGERSRYDFFGNGIVNDNGNFSTLGMQSSSTVNSDVMTPEELLFLRRQQQQKLHAMMLQQQQQLQQQQLQQQQFYHQQQQQRNPAFPAFETTLPDQSFLYSGSRDQRRPFSVHPGQYQQQQQYQAYLQHQQLIHHQQRQQQQQQYEMMLSHHQQQQRLQQPRPSLNGSALNGIPVQPQPAGPVDQARRPREPEAVVLQSEERRWQDGLKALFPNVNISFGPSPPFVKDGQGAPADTGPANGHPPSVDGGSFGPGEGTLAVPVHEMASLDPAIVNTGAVANFYSFNESYGMHQQPLLQHQQQQYLQPFRSAGHSRFPLGQPAAGRSFDWQSTDNAIVPQSSSGGTRRQGGAVPPPPGFENVHPQRKDVL